MLKFVFVSFYFVSFAWVCRIFRFDACLKKSNDWFFSPFNPVLHTNTWTKTCSSSQT